MSHELKFSVPWPSRSEVKKSLPNSFKVFGNVRLIVIDCPQIVYLKAKNPFQPKDHME